MIWKKRGKEFDEIARIICNQSMKYYIWGAGTFGQSFYNMFKDKINIIGFIDSDPEKQGTVEFGKEFVHVYSPTSLRPIENVKIIVGTGWITEVYSELVSKNFRPGKDFFHANDFMSIYMFYKEKKVYAISANIDLTTKCTLKCEKCMALIPYVKHPEHFSLETIQKELDTYFQWVDYLGVLGLGGGDVFLHPQFDEILEWVCKTYVGYKVQDVEIYTNAIIMPTAKTLELCRKYNVIVRFSDYSKELSGRQNIEQFTRLLEKNRIRFDKCVWDTWYDIGFPQATNGLTSEEELIKHYDKCITKLCSVIYDKKLYFCSVHASAVIAGYCKAEEYDNFDLERYNETKKKEFIEFNAGFCQNGYLTYCRRCNGYQNINNKFVPVAKQLKRTSYEIC